MAKSSLPKRMLMAVAVLLALFAVSVFAVRQVYYRNLQPVSNSQKIVLITIETGTASSTIATMLEEKGLIRNSTIFEWYIRSHEVRDKLQAGTYALRPSMDVPEIVNILVKGKITSDLVTILPGKRIDQIREALINAGFDPQAVEKALKPGRYENSPALVDKPASASLEGYLYPESFQKTDNTPPSVIIAASLDEMAKRLTPSIRAAFAKQGLNVYQGITLASIIEKEVPSKADRAKVAQVFLKRLEIGMPLGADPTATYGAIIAGQEPSFTYDSPYNTHLHKGLPPGPISNVTESALKAVAHPATTDWLYFVSGDDGKTYFSKTLEDHEALTERYCRKLCSGVQ